MSRTILASPGFYGRAIGTSRSNRSAQYQGPNFPLVVHPSGRYLTDSSGVPFLIVGDAAWSLISQVALSDAIAYLDDRAARGFTAIICEVMEHEFTDNSPAWRNANGDLPFNAGNDFTVPTTAFFAHAVNVLTAARDRGLAVFLCPAYVGFPGSGEGWESEMTSQTNGAMQTYGAYLAAKLAGCQNVVWVNGGDQSPTGTLLARANAVADAIRSMDTSRLMTAHVARGDNPRTVFSGSTWPLHVGEVYNDGASPGVYQDGKAEYDAAPARPFTLIEAKYENEGATAQQVRWQAYWTILTGGIGHFFGNNPIWAFGAAAALGFQTGTPTTDWLGQLASTGSQHMSLVAKAFARRAWWKLVPDEAHAVLTAGVGTNGNADFATTGRASDGSLVIAYVPTVRAVTIDMTKLSAPANAFWFDPTNGIYNPVAGGPFSNAGTRNFTAPSSNAAGDGDWALIVEVA